MNEYALYNGETFSPKGNRYCFGKLYECYYMEPNQFGYWRMSILCVIVIGVVLDWVVDHNLKYDDELDIGNPFIPNKFPRRNSTQFLKYFW